MQINKLLISFSAIILCGMALSACKSEEQGRPLRFEKGTYGGAMDTALSEEVRRNLRARAEKMGQ